MAAPCSISEHVVRIILPERTHHSQVLSDKSFYYSTDLGEYNEIINRISGYGVALRPDNSFNGYMSPAPGNTPVPPVNGAVDDVSKAIIEQLQADGRRSYGAIGKAVGLSEAAVRQRVQKMVESGMMQIVAVTDPLQLGFSRQAMLGIRAEADLLKVADEISALSQISYCVVTGGSFDILAEVICENDHDLLRVINEIRSISGVAGTETFMYLSLRKQAYNWGTR